MTGRAIAIETLTGVEQDKMMRSVDDICPTFEKESDFEVVQKKFEQLMDKELAVMVSNISVESPEAESEAESESESELMSTGNGLTQVVRAEVRRFGTSNAEPTKSFDGDGSKKSFDVLSLDGRPLLCSDYKSSPPVTIEKATKPVNESSSESSPTTDSTDCTVLRSRKTRLRFTTLTVREYPRVLGDNICMRGAPISLGWEFQDQTTYDIDAYEEACEHSRRTQTELKMPSTHRDKILRESGFSAKEILEAVKKSNIARNQRKRTVEMLKMQPLYEAVEKVSRVGKKLRFGKKDPNLRNMKQYRKDSI